MSLERELQKRSNSQCELCTNSENLKVYQVLPTQKGDVEDNLMSCSVCINQIEDPEATDANHWRCLNDSMWSEHKAVQVIAWRMLSRLRAEGWPQDLLDMMYLEEDTLEWAKSTGEGEDDSDKLFIVMLMVSFLRMAIQCTN